MKLFIKRYIYYIASFLVTIALIIFLCNINKIFKNEVVDEYYEYGMTVLGELEEKSVSEVDNRITTLNEEKKKLELEEAMKSESLESVEALSETEERDYREYFKNDVFMGDSLVEPFNVYGFLDSSSVVAKVGGNLVSAEESVDTVMGLNPNNVFILYGLNDLLIYDDKNEFINKYNELINSLKARKSDVNIYVTSIFYVRPDIASSNALLSLERVNEFNEGLKEMCNKNKYKYIDINKYLTAEYYEPDGMHVIGSFYYVWLDALINQIEGNNL